MAADDASKEVTADGAAEGIARAGRFLAARGWAPAGSGNYSMRRDDGTIAITVSGAHKAFLSEGDVMALDQEGRPLDGRRPSAEAAVHLMLYRLYPQARAVLHTHSIPVVTLLRGRSEPSVRLAGYELLKAFPGVETHAVAIDIPVVDNSQNMDAVAAEARTRLAEHPAPALAIRDHGLYGWGASLDEALRVIEAAETLFACELETLRLNQEPEP